MNIKSYFKDKRHILSNAIFVGILIFICVFFLFSVKDDAVLLHVRLAKFFAAALFFGSVAYILGHSREDSKRNAGVLLSAFVFSVTLFWAQFGIDFGDDGLNSTVSWFFVNDGMKGSSNRFYIGSTILNGIWMNLHTPPLLFWNRLGAVLMITIEFLLVYKMFRKYSTAAVLLGIAAAWGTLIGLRGTAEIALNYSSMPAFLSTIFIYFLYLADSYHQKEISALSTKKFGISKSNVATFFSGLIALLVILSRLPMFTLVIFAFFYFGWLAFLQRDVKVFLGKMMWFVLGMLAMLLMLAAFSYFVDGMTEIAVTLLQSARDMIFRAEKVTAGPAANFAGEGKVTYLQFLILLYSKGAAIIIVASLLWLCVWIFGGRILLFIEKKFGLSGKTEKFLLFAFFTLGQLLVFGIILPNTWYYFFYGFILSVYILLIIRRSPCSKLFFFLFWGIVWAVCSMLGSNTGVKQMLMGAFLLCPAVMAAIQNEIEIDGKIFQKRESALIVAAMVGFLVLSGYSKIFDVNLRDVDKIRCTAQINDPFFVGIRTGELRAAEVDKVMKILRSEMKPSDTFLCFNSIPMFYYALNKKFLLSDPWIMQMGDSSVKNELAGLRAANRSPDYVLFSVYSGRDADWAKSKVKFSTGEEEKYNIVTEFLSHPEYETIFKDDYFIIYRKIR